jgi:gas vesicle protein
MAENDSGTSVLAFALGGLVGAALGILLAPCSGNETRRRLARWSDDAKEKAQDLVEGEAQTLRQKKEQIQAAWEAGKKAYRETGSVKES